MKITGLLPLLLCSYVSAAAQQLTNPEPLGEPPTTVYRQVTPDGRIIYSDKAQQGAKIDHTLKIEPPIEGNLWSIEGGRRPAIPPQVESTPVKQVNAIPSSGRRRTVEEANSDVIRAEMLLEDARRKREAGYAPLPEEAEQTGPRNAHAARQAHLAREVAQAEAALRQAISERDALRRKH